MKPHALIHMTDADGREVVGVRLTNADEAAWLYLSDYRRIVEDHGTPTWRLVKNGKGQFYVRFKQVGRSSRNVTVARLVAGDFERTGVRYRDCNPFNLRSSNLYHVDGGGLRPKALHRSGGLRSVAGNGAELGP
ncbi:MULTISPECIES: hypothetical protein [Methylobacterium]|uniref:hypothetical protein n=1 Tax=Methylobacterium TaxID=407 RepID=UPI0011133F0E|nr:MULTISPECIES: hypothetical protein [Methylobacterium]MBK3396728.1 hypothetical protein [Methylobacterium ajmalii]MBK3407340.1 hypothetical protein [Methylobacterium ajmalii]MBK3420455.1 hypothetical protein [Methylobacterium ajmalii]MBZ6414067.1 hypothetical protein [Methylobacterium sp.]